MLNLRSVLAALLTATICMVSMSVSAEATQQEAILDPAASKPTESETSQSNSLESEQGQSKLEASDNENKTSFTGEAGTAQIKQAASLDGVSDSAKESSAQTTETAPTSSPLTGPIGTANVSVSEASNWPFVMLTLLGMVACILVIAWFVKRFSGLSALGGKDLRVVSAIAIGSRERVAIVDVRGEQFLIGATPHNISLLHHFSEAPIEARSPGKSDFAEKLQSILKQDTVSSKGER